MSAQESSVTELEIKEFWSGFLWSKHNRAGTRGVIFAPHPQLVFFDRERVTVVLSSGILLLLGLTAFVGTFLAALRDVLVADGLVSYQSSAIDEPSGWLFGWSLAVAVPLGALIHECGHWLAFRLTGRKLKVFVIGNHMSVTADRGPANSYQRLLTSAAGGLLEASFGFLILATQGGFGWNGLQIVATALILNGLANVLIPLRPRADGWRVWSSLFAILIGRGGRALERESESPVEGRAAEIPQTAS